MDQIIENVKVHQTAPNWKYPLLSEFIEDLKKVLDKHGDGYVAFDGEFTDEVHSILVCKDCKLHEIPDGSTKFVIG